MRDIYRMKKTTARREDYLKLIYKLSQKGDVRGSDIADGLEVTRPTVSVCLRRLMEDGDITMDRHRVVHLTEQGREIAESTQRKHNFLAEMLVSLGVPEDIAAEDACGMEHNLSAESYEALKRMMDEKSGK